MPDINKALDVYVRLAAAAGEYDLKQLREILEGYYELRRAAEEWRVTVQSTVDVGALAEQIEKLTQREAAACRREEDAEISAPPSVTAEEPVKEAEELEGFEAAEVKKPGAYLRGTAAAKFKRLQRERLEAVRKEKGLTLQAIADASGGGVRMSDLLSILEGATADYRIYTALAITLDKFDKD